MLVLPRIDTQQFEIVIFGTVSIPAGNDQGNFVFADAIRFFELGRSLLDLPRTHLAIS